MAHRPRSRVLRALISVLVAVAVLACLRVAAGAFIRTSTRPTLAPEHPAAPAATAAAPATSAAPPGSIRLLFTGDMLASDDLLTQAHRDAAGHGYNFMPMLAHVAPYIAAADFSICHQETPVSDNDRGLRGYPSFNAPFELAAAEKKVGYDACDTASNHTLDLGAGGVDATLGTLDRFGLRHVGSARNAADAARAVIYDVKGVKVGHLAYTYGLNGQSASDQRASQPWLVNLIDPARIRADAHRLKQAGAQIVIVSMHMGTEKDQTPSAYERQTAAAVMQSPDVDLVVGCHAHVVQPIQRRADGRYVIYGLGNFLAQQSLAPGEGATPPHRDGVIVEATFTPGGGRYQVTQMGYIPTFVTAPADRVTLAPEFSRKRTVDSLTAMGAPLADITPP